MKPISPTIHGLTDAFFVVATVALRRVVPARAPLRRFLGASSVAVAAISACTSYRWGLVKLLSMRGHLILEVPVSTAFLAAPVLFRHERRLVTGGLAAMGAGGTAVAMLTQTDPPAR
jgi:hypothetical protein